MISKLGRYLISVLVVTIQSPYNLLWSYHAVFVILTASRMLYDWHNLYLATIWYHSLLFLANLLHAYCFYFTWLHPFLTTSRQFLLGIYLPIKVNYLTLVEPLKSIHFTFIVCTKPWMGNIFTFFITFYNHIIYVFYIICKIFFIIIITTNYSQLFPNNYRIVYFIKIPSIIVKAWKLAYNLMAAR